MSDLCPLSSSLYQPCRRVPQSLLHHPPLGTSPYRSHRRVPQSLLHRLLSRPVCTGPTNGHRNIYCPVPPLSISRYQSYRRVRRPPLRRPTPNTDLQHLANGSSNKTAGVQWSKYPNIQSSQGSSSQQPPPPRRSRTPFHYSHHRFRLHNPASLRSEQRKRAPRICPTRWQHEVASTRHPPHQRTCRW